MENSHEDRKVFPRNFRHPHYLMQPQWLRWWRNNQSNWINPGNTVIDFGSIVHTKPDGHRKNGVLLGNGDLHRYGNMLTKRILVRAYRRREFHWIDLHGTDNSKQLHSYGYGKRLFNSKRNCSNESSNDRCLTGNRIARGRRKPAVSAP
jgi:hypothetical protein